jgi:D-alanyl-lipoteichoic acid acyltransferase DltB (MBOAT superfamily)
VVFNSLQYAVFFPVVLAIYWSLTHRGQNLLLLVASYVFYAAFDWRFLGLMWLSTLTDFAVGRLLGRVSADGRRKAIFLISLVVNLGILGFFKYYDFFSSSLAPMLDRLGLHGSLPTLQILLPIGISFYTFHGISYTFDVYRRDIEPARKLVDFAVFVAFFPQLVAGPIGRAQRQLPQFEQPRQRPSIEQAGSGVFLIFLGLFKKVAIADAIAPMLNAAFARPTSQGSLTLLLGAYAFALQIYADFSGYSDIARGSARLLGIELPVNFAQPYLSRNIREFWRTWHISLSQWLRDYLYVPLGGNRSSRWKTYRNLMLTMVLGGLWHGAALHFVVWGALHGIFLCLARSNTRAAPESPVSRRDVLPIIATFHLVCLGWIFFRTSIGGAVHYLGGIMSLRPGLPDANDLILLGVAFAAMLTIDLVQPFVA